MWKWISNPLPTSEISLTCSQHLHYLFVSHTPEIGVLTGIYFLECQVPSCSRRYVFYVTAFYWGQWPRSRSLEARVEFNVTLVTVVFLYLCFVGAVSGFCYSAFFVLFHTILGSSYWYLEVIFYVGKSTSSFFSEHLWILSLGIGKFLF